MATTMKGQLRLSGPVGARAEIQDFATGAAWIAEQFSAGNALGVMLFDLSMLERVEQALEL